jgi:hypothetical protein
VLLSASLQVKVNVERFVGILDEPIEELHPGLLSEIHGLEVDSSQDSAVN